MNIIIEKRVVQNYEMKQVAYRIQKKQDKKIKKILTKNN